MVLNRGKNDFSGGTKEYKKDTNLEDWKIQNSYSLRSYHSSNHPQELYSKVREKAR